MKHNCHFEALVCLAAFSASQLPAQVLSRTNSGFTTPETVQVNTSDAGVPYYSIASISAQDVDGDGKTDLLVSGPSTTSTSQPGPITSTLLRNAGDENFQQIFGNHNSYCQPGFEVINNNVNGFCTLADLNGDGMPDKIFAQEFQNPSAVPGTDYPNIEVDYPEIKVQLAVAPGTYAAPLKYVLAGKAHFISSIALGDFNGDRRTDIAVLVMSQIVPYGANGAGASLVILYGNSDGSFTPSNHYATNVYYGFDYRGPPAVQYLTAGNYLKLAALDLNGDGTSDIIVYSPSESSPTNYFLGASSGLSLQSDTGGIGYITQYMVAANLHGNGIRDLVAVYGDNTVHVLTGAGPGSPYSYYFSSDQQLPPLNEVNPSVMDIVIADLNGDGRPDIVVDSEDMIDIYRQAEDGSFSAPRQYSTSVTGGDLAIADFNGDGNLDIAVGGNPLDIFYGDGYGSFTGPAISSSPATFGIDHTGPYVIADFNRDGHADVAEAADTVYGHYLVSVFRGSGAGWFQPPVEYMIPNAAAGMGTGDLNGDGIPDLVVNGSLSNTGPDTSVLLGEANGTFSPAKAYTLGIPYSYNVLLRDVNNDGKLDLITDKGVNLGRGDGTFGPLIPFPISPLIFLFQIATGDFNHDGKLDILYEGDMGVSVLLGDGDGHFIIKQSANPLVGSYPAVGYLNGGNSLDFAATYFTSAGDGIVIYLGNGDGTFRQGSTAALKPSNGLKDPGISSLTVQDVNGDGTEDIVVGTYNNQIQVFLGKGNGNFAAPLIFPDVGYSYNVPTLFADFNSDGAPDLIMSVGDGFARFLNTGFKTWPAPSSLPTAPSLNTSVATASATER